MRAEFLGPSRQVRPRLGLGGDWLSSHGTQTSACTPPSSPAASPASAEDARPAPVSAPAPPVRASRGQGSAPATVAGGQVGPEAPRPPGTSVETR